MKAEQKLVAARCRLLSVLPYYGSLCLPVVWKESKFENLPSKTMGVRVVGGRVECIWYRPFVDSLRLEQLVSVIHHELEHLLRLHCVRRGDRDPYLFNIACDAVVNGFKHSPRIAYKDGSETVLPVDADKMIWIPDDWPGNETAEYYYDRMLGNATVVEVVVGNNGEILDNHDLWNQTDMAPDEIRQVVHNWAKQAAVRSAGNVPGHVTELLESLANPLIGWRSILKRFVGRHAGNRRKTYARRDRRNDKFGFPGSTRHAAATANVIVDTSGSVSHDELKQFFSEIDAMAGVVRVNVLQWDHAFQGYGVYRRGDWKSFKITGRGGTDMAAPVAWLIEKHCVADMQIMLTDGETGWADPSIVHFPAMTVITTEHDGPQYGRVVRLK